jgi:hypothetical protein
MVLRGQQRRPRPLKSKYRSQVSSCFVLSRPRIHQHLLDTCSRCAAYTNAQSCTNPNPNTRRHHRVGLQRWRGGLEGRAGHSRRDYPAIFIRVPFVLGKDLRYSLYVGGRGPSKQQALGIRAPGHCRSKGSWNTTSVLHCTLMGPLAILLLC